MKVLNSLSIRKELPVDKDALCVYIYIKQNVRTLSRAGNKSGL